MPVRIEFAARYTLAVFEGTVTTDQIATAIGKSMQLVSRSVRFGLDRMAEILGEGHGLTIRVFDLG